MSYKKIINENLQNIFNEYFRMSEMPSFNDANKSIGDELGGPAHDALTRTKEDEWDPVDDFDTGEYHIYVWYGHKTYMMQIMDEDNDIYVAEGIWYHDTSYPIPGFRTESVGVYSPNQGQGLAKSMYRHMLESHFQVLYSDNELTGEDDKGSFHLWQSLSKEYDSYVFDLKTEEYKEIENIQDIHMGNSSDLFVISTEPLL